MSVVHQIGRVNLRAVEQALAGHVGGHIVEHQVAEDIRNEIDFGVSRKNRKLRVAIGAFLLQRRDVDDVSVVFVLIERRRAVIGWAEISERHLIGVVWYLERVVGRGGDYAEPCRFVEQGRRITEEFALLSVIVLSIEVGRRIFKPKSVPIAPRGDEIFRIADAAAIIEAWRERLPAAAIETDLAARYGIASADDVEDAGGAQSVLRRQRSGKQRTCWR